MISDRLLNIDRFQDVDKPIEEMIEEIVLV